MRTSLVVIPTPILALALAASTAACAGAPPVRAPAGNTLPAAPTAPPTATAMPAPASQPATAAPTGDVHDFDFMAGAWTVINHRLKARWVGSTEWDEFPATDCATIYLGSVADVDEIRFPTKGWAGLTLRNFHADTHQWSIYWVNSRDGEMFPPEIGGFQGDHGEFYGDDKDGDRAVKVRFRWTKLGPDHAHWEQAFSLDGQSWEVNWTNDFTRADPKHCDHGRWRD